ncbi:hypothetical protein DFH08DRAFT_953931 [Mycena albidolilacea]|uniref:DUF6533 domain-containing protein n=1 Tax=Mycena albidolilacea TaxID=1033008 RepID=A0AAD7AEA1_9AGAR|nr:hypothetical protein DFH08DRAFT_953931 [Mycena albidolilacea]
MSQPLAVGSGHPPPSPVRSDRAPNALQGSALAALIWVGYDSVLTLDREVASVWRSPWSVTKCLYLFLRYNSLAALAFYFVETLGTTPFIVMLDLPQSNPHISAEPCLRSLNCNRTEILCVLMGEALILLRINALYGWERKWVICTVFSFLCEAIVGIVTTVVTLQGGSGALAGSTNILDCSSVAQDVPDVNIGMWCTSILVVCIYFAMIFRKTQDLAIENSKTMWQILWASDLLPTIHLCLKDACAYFLVVFGNDPVLLSRRIACPDPTTAAVLLMNLVLITAKLGYAQIGTPWLIATYTVASTRIFLNLKNLGLRSSQYNSATWSEFERASVLDFREVVPEL